MYFPARTMTYHPGTHIIATLKTSNEQSLKTHAGLGQLILSLIERYHLKKLGDVYHDFSPAGFTAVICLSESHISVHTWPEHNLVNLDIYLSNFERNNDGTVQGIYSALKVYFNGTVTNETILTR